MKQKLAAVIFLPLVFLVAQAQTPLPKNSSLPNVTGHYRLRQDEFRNSLDVHQLPGGKIKFQLVALWVSYNNPENIHNGELRGTATLEKGVAIYETGTCKITMSFTLNRVAVAESDSHGDCGFGANVTAVGSYRKINRRKPKFDF